MAGKIHFPAFYFWVKLRKQLGEVFRFLVADTVDGCKASAKDNKSTLRLAVACVDKIIKRIDKVVVAVCIYKMLVFIIVERFAEKVAEKRIFPLGKVVINCKSGKH